MAKLPSLTVMAKLPSKKLSVRHVHCPKWNAWTSSLTWFERYTHTVHLIKAHFLMHVINLVTIHLMSFLWSYIMLLESFPCVRLKVLYYSLIHQSAEVLVWCVSIFWQFVCLWQFYCLPIHWFHSRNIMILPMLSLERKHLSMWIKKTTGKRTS